MHFNSTVCSQPKPLVRLLDTGFDLLERLVEFYRNINTYGKFYASHNVMLLLGDDFSFKNFSLEMGVWQPILHALNANRKSLFNGSRFLFSTPGEYFDALQTETERGLQLHEKPLEDFFPLIDDYFDKNPVAWTGYFTTRPHLKRSMKRFGQLVRLAGDAFARLLLAKTGLRANNRMRDYLQATEKQRWLVGVNTHHDAITGTCEKLVCEDYHRRMQAGVHQLSDSLLLFVLQPLLGVQLQAKLLFEDRLIPADPDKPSQSFLLLSPRLENLPLRFRLPAPRQSLALSIDGLEVRDFSSICDDVAGCEYSFFPPRTDSSLRLASLKLSGSRADSAGEREHRLARDEEFEVALGNGRQLHLLLTADSIAVAEAGSTMKASENQVKIGWAVYKYSKEWCSLHKYFSGSYAFSTCNPTPYPLQIVSAVVRVFDGKRLVLSLDFRDDRLKAHIEYSCEQESGQLAYQIKSHFKPFFAAVEELDFVVRVKSMLANDKRFFTDSNGLESIQRVYGSDYGDSPEFSYYPVSRFIYLQDDTRRVALLTDRAQGGTSSFQGGLELMLQRVNREKDRLGLNSKLAETHAASIEHTLLIEDLALADQERYRQREKTMLIFALASDIAGVSDALSKTNAALSLLREQLGEMDGLEETFDVKNDGHIMMRLINKSETRDVLYRNLDGLRSLVSSITERPIDYNLFDAARQHSNSHTNDQVAPASKVATVKPLNALTLQLSL